MTENGSYKHILDYYITIYKNSVLQYLVVSIFARIVVIIVAALMVRYCNNMAEYIVSFVVGLITIFSRYSARKSHDRVRRTVDRALDIVEQELGSNTLESIIKSEWEKNGWEQRPSTVPYRFRFLERIDLEFLLYAYLLLALLLYGITTGRA